MQYCGSVMFLTDIHSLFHVINMVFNSTIGYKHLACAFLRRKKLKTFFNFPKFQRF